LSGLAYSILGVVLRYASNRNTPLPSLLFTVGLVGVILLGGISLWRTDGSTLLSQSRPQLLPLVAAGLFNVMAFWALTKALQLSSVLFVNALNASQTAMAAVAGVLLFHEPLSGPMLSGVVLTAVGLLLMRNRRSSPSPQKERSR
jgi:drug/metabolite transporter (DMT)-like permease